MSTAGCHWCQLLLLRCMQWLFKENNEETFLDSIGWKIASGIWLGHKCRGGRDPFRNWLVIHQQNISPGIQVIMIQDAQSLYKTPETVLPRHELRYQWWEQRYNMGGCVWKLWLGFLNLWVEPGCPLHPHKYQHNQSLPPYKPPYWAVATPRVWCWNIAKVNNELYN